MSSNFKSSIELGVGVGGGLSLLSGLVTDFLIPIAPYGFYLASAILLLLILSLILFFMPVTNNYLRNKLKDIWYFPIFLLLCISMSSTYSLYYLSSSSGENGFLSANIDEISTLQHSMGLIQDSLNNIELSTASIDKKMDNVKKETSSDPRKELSNMGLSWQYSNFIDTLTNQDIKAIKLYLQGGMKLRDDDFVSYVNELFTISTSKMLLQYKAFESDAACPTHEYRMSFYTDISEKLDKLDFVRKVCSIPRVFNYLDSQISKEKNSLDSKNQYNKNLNLTREICISDLKKVSTQQYYDDTDGYDPMKSVLSSYREIVVAKLYHHIVIYGVGVAMDKEYLTRFLQKTFVEICRERNQEVKINSSKLEMLVSIKKLLSK